MAAEDTRNLPVPDPTVLTTQLVDRALGGYRQVVETRLAGMDRATELVARELEQQASDVDIQRERLRGDFDREMAALREWLLGRIENVRDVGLEKFAGIETRFIERDTRTEQAAQENRISLAAALAAQKEAVGEQNKANTAAITKSEAATVKQIDAVVSALDAAKVALDDKISDIKTRLDRGEGGTASTQQARTQSNWSVGVIVAVAVSVGTALLSLGATIVIAIINHH